MNPSNAAAGPDVVYSFIAPSAGNYSFRVKNSTVPGDETADNLVLYIAADCLIGGGTPTCLDAANRTGTPNSNTTIGAEEVFCEPLSTAQQVFVYVDTTDATPANFTIEVNRCDSETEPNDMPAQANTPSCGIEGSISPTGEVDFFALGAPPAGARAFAMVDGVAANHDNFDLRVTTDTQTLEFDDANNAAPFGARSANVSGVPVTGENLFLRVNHEVTNSQPYRLYSVIQPPLSSAISETEPNDSVAQANTASQLYFSGTLAGSAPSDDIDVYSFTATAGDLIFLALDGDPLRDVTPINGAARAPRRCRQSTRRDQ